MCAHNVGLQRDSHPGSLSQLILLQDFDIIESDKGGGLISAEFIDSNGSIRTLVVNKNFLYGEFYVASFWVVILLEVLGFGDFLRPVVPDDLGQRVPGDPSCEHCGGAMLHPLSLKDLCEYWGLASRSL